MLSTYSLTLVLILALALVLALVRISAILVPIILVGILLAIEHDCYRTANDIDLKQIYRISDTLRVETHTSTETQLPSKMRLATSPDYPTGVSGGKENANRNTHTTVRIRNRWKGNLPVFRSKGCLKQYTSHNPHCSHQQQNKFNTFPTMGDETGDER